MEGSKKPYISPSQISSYTRCGEAYRRRYLQGERIPPSIAITRGISVHKGAEKNFKQKIESRQDLPVGDTVDLAVSTFEGIVRNEGVILTPDEESVGRDKIVSEAKDSTAKTAELLAKDVMPSYQPVEVETPVEINLDSSSHNLRGIVDLTVEGDGIVDLKTSGKSWTQERADRDGQFTFYSMLHRSKTGKDPEFINIENLVATKKPKRILIRTTRSMDDYEPMINRMNRVIDGINKGVFSPPMEGSWWCGPVYCGYWSTCPYVNRKRSPK